ncbi:hypothetical protein [uncultured Jatrophihabitans sp.]|uniref:hypothetical protein n=1 Tax=uncultured Jatrophihabitans sp. TaxID=1610747 RepID=UPI0035CC379B
MTFDDPHNSETRRLPRQPQYGQEPYGQQPYGQQPHGQPGFPQQPPTGQRPRFNDSTANPFGAASDQAFGIVSTVLALLGGIVGVVALTGLEWFKGGATFSDTDNLLDGAGDRANSFASAYFGWLAWTFLIVAVIAALAASFPSPALRIMRVIGVVVGIAAAGLSFLALQWDIASYSEVIKNARIGFYLLVIAFVLVGTGAGIGPRKV